MSQCFIRQDLRLSPVSLSRVNCASTQMSQPVYVNHFCWVMLYKMPSCKTCIYLLFVQCWWLGRNVPWIVLYLTTEVYMCTLLFKYKLFHSYRVNFCNTWFILSSWFCTLPSIVCKLHTAHVSCHAEADYPRYANYSFIFVSLEFIFHRLVVLLHPLVGTCSAIFANCCALAK